MSRREGFTLLEILLAVVIALLLITIAVPGIASLLREEDLKRTFQSFDEFVHDTQLRAVKEHRGFRLVFDDAGVAMVPTDPTEEDATGEIQRFDFDAGHTYAIERPTALMKDPPPEWPFWESGVCELAIVSYTGPKGSWKVRYDPLTVRGTLEEQNVK